MKKSWLLACFLLVLLLPACGGEQIKTGFPETISGSEGGLYPVQDLSVIAATNRVQFLNVYANW